MGMIHLTGQDIEINAGIKSGAITANHSESFLTI
jgi:hypothetical protein